MPAKTWNALAKRRMMARGISAAALMIGGGSVHAQSLRPGYTPAANNGGGTQAQRADIIDVRDATSTITGDYALRGTSARRFEFDSDTIAARNANGDVVSGYEAVAGRSNVVLGTQQKTASVTYPDQIQGTRLATLVYDNDRLASVASVDTRTVTYVDTNAPVYGDLRLANIDNSAVTIATGDVARSVYDDANFALLTADSGSTLYNVTNGSRIVYASRTATMDGADQDGLSQPASVTVAVPVTTYSGIAFDGGDAVTDLASLKRYNTSLIAQLTAGTITPETYESRIQAAAAAGTRDVTVRTPVIPPYTAPPTISERLFIKLDRSSLVTTAGSELVGVVGADGNNDGISTLILAQNGSSVTNNGTIAQGEGGVGIRVKDAGSSLTNTETGVIGVGYETLDRSSGRPMPSGLTDYLGYGTGNIAIRATDGATIVNRGIVNVANRDIPGHDEDPTYGKANAGIAVSSGATASNAGTILIGGADSAVANTLGLFGGAAGLVAFDGGTATNAATGVIRVGTSFAGTVGDLAGVVDVLSVNPAAGMTSLSGGGTIVNDGTIRIGSLAQNASGMLVGGDGNTAVNTGTIVIDPSATTTPSARNVGIRVRGSSVAGAVGATNAASGIITVGGVNGVGLLVENTVAGGSARAVNAGRIVVDGGLSVDRLRNYGLFVAGPASSARQDGAVVLRGDGAIGVHARDGGTIDAGTTGSVDFQGIGQIGYYTLGAGSRIAVASTTNVDTTGSTGFRVEDGATLTGGALNLIVSGAGAFGIVGSGASTGTTVDTSGSRITVSGAGATGVVIEGGATGVLSGLGTITLAGAGTTAAVVDGQKHTLDGTATGTPVATTALASTVTLASSFDDLTGYVARNQSQLAHGGTIAFTGARGTAILATTGASVTNSGAIAIGGGGTGIRLLSTGAGDVVSARDTGTITVGGGSVAARSRGIQADGAGAVATLASPALLILNGNGAIGAEAVRGGRIVLETGVGVRFAADAADQIAFRAAGAGATILASAQTLDATGTRATLFRFDDGAQGRTDAASVLTASGIGSSAVVAAGPGTTYAGSGAFVVSGADASALRVQGGAAATLDAASRIAITANGTGAIVDGRSLALDGSFGTSQPATLDSTAMLSGAGPGARGYVVGNGGVVSHGGTIALSGADAAGIVVTGAGSTATNGGAIRLTGSGTGVDVRAGGAFANTGTIAVTSGTGIALDGAGSTLSGTGAVSVGTGVAALRLGNGATAVTAGSLAAGGTAHGVLLGAGAGALTLGTGMVTVSGTGNGIENAAGSLVRLNGTTIVANGSGAAVHSGVALDPASTGTLTAAGGGSTGFDFSDTGGSVVATDLALGTGLAITASGVGATGVRLATTGNVTSGGTIRVTNAQGGSAIVAGPAASVTNTGALVSASIASPVVDLTGGTRAFANSGTVTAASAEAVAIAGGGTGQAVTLSAGAVTGGVLLGGGADRFVMSGGTLTGAFDAGGGDDSAVFRGLSDANLSGVTRIAGAGTAGGGDVLTFDATTATGTRRITGWNGVALTNASTLTADGDLTMAGGSVTIDRGSTFFAGNGANARITGGTLRVVNAGTIDLTNGASGAGDRLTIRGDYVGQGGTLRLQTVLGNDASPTDRLVIDGGSASGTTTIQVANVGGLGAATTGNGIELIGAINGARTTATTTKDAFALAGTHVDAGAFEYRLYASDIGGTSESWFLRTQAGSTQTEVPTPTPTPVTPTTPTPVGGLPSTPAEVDPTYRVEVPLLAALPGRLQQADLTMLSTYHRRMGDTDGDVAPGFSVPGRIWGRFIAEDGRSRQRGDARTSIDGHLYGGQLGVDLFRFGGPSGHHDVGIYGGYIDAKTRVNGFASGVDGLFAGRLDPTSTYAGLYWTYQADSGFYTDTVVQFAWYGGKAQTPGGTRIGIDGTGVLASVETGYPVVLTRNWTLEPQAQLIGQGVSIDDVAIANATVTQRTPGYLTGRLGLRLKGRYATSAGSVQPYLRANVWKGFASTDRTLFATAAATTAIATRSSSLWGEAGAGLTWALTPALALYGEGDHRFSLDDGQGIAGHATSGTVGVRLRF